MKTSIILKKYETFENIRSRILNNFHSQSGVFCIDSFGKNTSSQEFVFNVKNIAYNLPVTAKKIMMLVEKNSDTYAAILSIIFLGKTWIPLSEDMPNNSNLEIIRKIKPELIIVSKNINFKFLNIIKKKFEVLFIDELINKKYSGHYQWPEIKESETAIIYHTSGSTGTPKGVETTFSNLSMALAHISPIFAKKRMQWGDYHDLSFGISIVIFFLCIYNNGKIFCANNKLDQISPVRSIIKNKIECLVTVPSTLHRMTNDIEVHKIFENLKVIASCGEPLKLDLLKFFIQEKTLLYNFYGSTEVSTWVFYHKCKKKDIITFKKHGFAPIGKLIPGNKCLISNDGELLISGPQLTKGYFGLPKNSHLKAIKGTEWYPMGDIVSKINNKFICTGRNDEQVKINGYRISIIDVENKILSFKEIDACICFIEKENNKTFLSCSLVSKNQISKIDLLIHLKSILPNYMIPKKYYILKKIPTNKNGKLDKFHMKNTNVLRQLI